MENHYDFTNDNASKKFKCKAITKKGKECCKSTKKHMFLCKKHKNFTFEAPKYSEEVTSKIIDIMINYVPNYSRNACLNDVHKYLTFNQKDIDDGTNGDSLHDPNITKEQLDKELDDYAKVRDIILDKKARKSHSKIDLTVAVDSSKDLAHIEFLSSMYKLKPDFYVDNRDEEYKFNII